MSKWVDVNDKLPEENKRVLVWRYLLPPEIDSSSWNKVYDLGYVWEGKWSIDYPIMWTELPKPPKKEGNNDQRRIYSGNE